MTEAAKRLALACLILGLAMAMIDTTIVNVALPTLRTDLGMDEQALGWVVSGYSFAGAVGLIPAGRLGDRLGHRGVYLAGILAFVLASLWCAFVQSGTELIIARIVQGLGASAFFPAVNALIQLMFTGRARGRAFAVMGAAVGVFTALGPLLGGGLIASLGPQLGWRAIFLVNLPIGLLILIGGWILLPRGTADPGSRMWPLLPLRLFRHTSFNLGLLLAALFFAAFTSIFFVLSVLWQDGLGHSAWDTGLLVTAFSAGAVIGAGASERIAHAAGRLVLQLGTGALATGIAALVVLCWGVAGDLEWWKLAGPLLVAGIGQGLFIAPNTTFIVATVAAADAGAASGVVSTLQRAGAAVGIAVAGGVFWSSLAADPMPPGQDYGLAAAAGLTVSAVAAIGAFLLVFALPKRARPKEAAS